MATRLEGDPTAERTAQYLDVRNFYLVRDASGVSRDRMRSQSAVCRAESIHTYPALTRVAAGIDSAGH